METADKITLDGSHFKAYTAKISSYQQIRDFYMKLKLTQPNARHIACAYMLPGDPHVSRDFHNDGEPGSGRILLELLEKNNKENTVVFVVRTYGGVKLGAARFTCYITVAAQVLRIQQDPPKQKQAGKREQNTASKNTDDTSPKALYQSEEEGHLLQANADITGPNRGNRGGRGRYSFYKRYNGGHRRRYYAPHSRGGSAVRGARPPSTRNGNPERKDRFISDQEFREQVERFKFSLPSFPYLFLTLTMNNLSEREWPALNNDVD